MRSSYTTDKAVLFAETLSISMFKSAWSRCLWDIRCPVISTMDSALARPSRPSCGQACVKGAKVLSGSWGLGCLVDVCDVERCYTGRSMAQQPVG